MPACLFIISNAAHHFCDVKFCTKNCLICELQKHITTTCSYNGKIAQGVHIKKMPTFDHTHEHTHTLAHTQRKKGETVEWPQQ